MQMERSNMASLSIPQQCELKLIIALQARFTQFLGMQLSWDALYSNTDFTQACRSGREHDWCCYVRIGMDKHRNQWQRLTSLRSESDTITLSAKSFESKRTELQSKYMRRLV